MPELGTSTQNMATSFQSNKKPNIVPNNSFADAKSGEPHPTNPYSWSHKGLQGRPSPSCYYCDSVFQNLQYLENYLRVSSTKSTCNCCATCLSFLVFMKQQCPRTNGSMMSPFLNPYLHNYYAGSYQPAQSMRNLYPRKSPFLSKNRNLNGTTSKTRRPASMPRNTSTLPKSNSAKKPVATTKSVPNTKTQANFSSAPNIQRTMTVTRRKVPQNRTFSKPAAEGVSTRTNAKSRMKSPVKSSFKNSSATNKKESNKLKSQFHENVDMDESRTHKERITSPADMSPIDVLLSKNNFLDKVFSMLSSITE